MERTRSIFFPGVALAIGIGLALMTSWGCGYSGSPSGDCNSDDDCSDPTPLCDRSTGMCVACLPDCGGRECGPDPVCEQSCGECKGGRMCAQGACICQSHVSWDCHDGNVWWFDSCGAPEEKIADCQQDCQDGMCTSCTPDCGGRR